MEYDNTLSRYFLLSSIVDFGRLDIGRYAEDTADKSVYQGRTYSNKAIGAPLLAVPFYFLLRKLTPLRRDPPLSFRACYLVSLWTSALPYALTGVVLYLLLLSMGVAAIDAYLAVLAYAFGTLAWTHATLFSGHQTAASLALMSFAALRCLGKTASVDPSAWAGAGLLLGLAGLTDYLCGWTAVVLAAYAWRRGPTLKTRLAFLAGLAACGAVLAAYNTACFDAPWRMSYAEMGPAFDGEWRQGWCGIRWPDPRQLLHLLVSPSRGLFFIMPVLLMALPGLGVMFRKGRELHDEAWLLALVPAGLLLANAGYYGWHGGWAFGPRYLVVALPFLAVPLAFALDRLWFAPLFCLSFLQLFGAQAVMPHVPQYIANPLVECLLPLWRQGYLADNLGAHRLLPGAWSLAPWFVVALGAAWLGRPPVEPGGCQRPRGWRPVYAAASLAILAGLVWVRSSDARTVDRYNVRLLEEARDSAAGL